MMAYESRDGFGAIFKNDKKGNEKAPDYRGDAMLGGSMVEIAGWLKEGKNGKFLSLTIKRKGDVNAKAPAAPPASRPAGANEFDDMDDNIPFN